MDKKKLLKVLNSLEIEEWSIDYGECEYVLVEDNDENRNILMEVGLTEEAIDKYAYEGYIDISIEGYIDISMIAWEHTNANWWSSETGFMQKKEGI